MKTNNTAIRIRLVILAFLQFAVWGAYLTSIGRYLYLEGLGLKIKWFFAMQGFVSLFMPALVGMIADRYIPAQKVLSLCHLLAGGFMLAAGIYCKACAGSVGFAELFTLYSVSVAFYMPTIALSYSVSFSAMSSAGMDPSEDFPSVRVFGTIGFIVSMLATNWLNIDGVTMQESPWQLIFSGIISLILCIYSRTLPACPVKNEGKSLFDFKALHLLKDRQIAVFFIFSILVGCCLHITNSYANLYLGTFASIPQYRTTFAANNSNALLAISQISETVCILFIPFCLRKFGIKGVFLLALVGWTLRFLFLGLGTPDWPGVLLFVLSCIVYGVAFDFFNISGSLYVDSKADPSVRNSAQGLFMLAINGLAGMVGILCAGAVVEKCGCFTTHTQSCIDNWKTAWYIFAAYAFAVTILFALCFKDKNR